jgi:hypothetical protein
LVTVRICPGRHQRGTLRQDEGRVTGSSKFDAVIDAEYLAAERLATDPDEDPDTIARAEVRADTIAWTYEKLTGKPLPRRRKLAIPLAACGTVVRRVAGATSGGAAGAAVGALGAGVLVIGGVVGALGDDGPAASSPAPDRAIVQRQPVALVTADPPLLARPATVRPRAPATRPRFVASARPTPTPTAARPPASSIALPLPAPSIPPPPVPVPTPPPTVTMPAVPVTHSSIAVAVGGTNGVEIKADIDSGLSAQVAGPSEVAVQIGGSDGITADLGGSRGVVVQMGAGHGVAASASGHPIVQLCVPVLLACPVASVPAG